MTGFAFNTPLPLTEAVTVATDVDFVPSVIYVGGSGSLTVRPAGSSADVVFLGVAGTTLPVLVTAVRSAGLVASGLVRAF